MTAAGSSDRLATAGATSRPIEPEQHRAARIAGLVYLLDYILVVFGQVAPSWIAGSGDFAERAHRVVASEHLYRLALTSMVLSWISIVVLAFALYVTLEPVNKRLAQLALLMRLGEAFIGAATLTVSFAMLQLYTSAQTAGPLHIDQLQALVAIARGASGGSFQIVMAFFSPGSILFFYLFYKAGYIPRLLAGLGLFASALMLAVTVGFLIFPEHGNILQLGWAPGAIAEIATALWLLIRGIRPAARPSEQAARA